VAVVREEIRLAALSAGRDPGEIKLLAAVKTQSVDRISQAVAAGVDAVGENRVQEMLSKLGSYGGTELHFIGKLQKNKVKQVVGRVSLIHSVESVAQAEVISRFAETQNIVQDVLAQVNIGREASKSGFLPSELERGVFAMRGLRGLRVRGIMCIPPLLGGENGGEEYFLETRNLFVDIRPKIIDNGSIRSEEAFSVLSMGMSGDFAKAAALGSTLVRVGSAIFGPRASA
jgi:pyridoxal phosphate enzyme (YggS family)